jgi:hypothetical protein
MSMKNSNDKIGNRTRNIPAWGACHMILYSGLKSSINEFGIRFYISAHIMVNLLDFEDIYIYIFE